VIGLKEFRGMDLISWLPGVVTFGVSSPLDEYWSILALPWHWWLTMRSTSYSSSPLIRSGGGQEKLGPCTVVS